MKKANKINKRENLSTMEKDVLNCLKRYKNFVAVYWDEAKQPASVIACGDEQSQLENVLTEFVEIVDVLSGKLKFSASS